MKRSTFVILLFALLFSLTACTNDKESSTTPVDDKPKEKTETTVNKEVEKSYTETELSVDVEGGKLSATLLVPKELEKSSVVPVVLFVPGSGPTPRDGVCNESKILAEKLAENDIASLRYDKRGLKGSANIKVGEETIRVSDYTDDVKALIQYLKKDERFLTIYVLGHSQGALYGAIAAKDENIDGFISLAGPSRPIDEVIKEQIINNKANPKEIVDESFAIVDSLKAGKKVEKMSAVLKPLFRPSIQGYMMDWMTYNPVEVYKALGDIPMMIIQGKHDIQVSVEDAEILSKALPSAKLVLIDKMTHVLKDTETDGQMENMLIYKDFQKDVNEELVLSIVEFVK